ncbi:MAG TPA: hypothetical protein DEO56_02590 [Nitrosomonas nitrosa]|nr:hypothetical protein [Nitrosomonas nitrosa]HNP52186.1 SGNH/GDSL hydrolase family protein [Nitrosomonas nitrosa]
MKSTRRKYEIYTGITVLALTLGIFLAGEIALRTIQWLKFGQQQSMELSNTFYIDETTGLRLNVPNQQLGMVHINNIGFRGPDIIPNKPINTIRLAFLGSSTTYDAYSPEGRNWPHLVAEKLAQHIGGCRIDFVNGGKPGYGYASMMVLFEHFIKPLQPDILMILPSETNADLSWLAEKQGLNTDHASYQSDLSRHSVLLEKLEKNFRVIQLQRIAENRTGKLRVELDILVERFMTNLSKLVNLVSSEDRVVGLITISDQLRRGMDMDELKMAGNTRLFFMPYIYLPDVIEVTEAYNAAIANISNKTNSVLITGENDIPGDRRYYQDSTHFTPAGSELMARRVVNQLLSSSQVHTLLQRNDCDLN